MKAMRTPLPPQRGDFAPQVEPEQPHEVLDLADGPLPVFGGERVDGEVADPALGAAFQDRPHDLGAAPMPGGSRQAARPCPAPVAIQDDADMEGRVLRGGE